MSLPTTTYSTVEFAEKKLKKKYYLDVRLYYTLRGEKYRPSIGIRLDPQHVLESGKISSRHPNFMTITQTIKDRHEKLEQLIRSYVNQHREKPPVDWLKKEYENEILAQQIKERKNLPTNLPLAKGRQPVNPQSFNEERQPRLSADDLNGSLSTNAIYSTRDESQDHQNENDHFDRTPLGPPMNLLTFWKEFLLEKEGIVRSVSTINGFKSLKYILDSFRELKNYALRFDLLDQNFFNDLIGYMIYDHISRRNKSQTYVEKGLANETIIKRLKDFSDYLNYCKTEREIPLKIDRIKRFIWYAKRKAQVRPLSSTRKWELTLTPEEIQFVINLDHFEPTYWGTLTEAEKRWLDILIFMCLQGTAPVDAKAIRSFHIRDGNIIKERNKSGNDFKVELDPVAENILKRHKYNMDFSEQVVNEGLKKLFVVIFELYRKYYEKKYSEPYELIYSQVIKKGSHEVYTIQHKGQFIELMTGRRSFMTNINEKADQESIKKNMKRSGHTRIETHLGYVHEQQHRKSERPESLFGVYRIEEGEGDKHPEENRRD